MIKENPIGKNVLKELFDNGYTWLKRDDLGFGSIQEKFGATDAQIALLRKHPLAKDLETNAVIFTIIDDTNNEPNINTPAGKTNPAVQPVPGPEVRGRDQENVLAEEYAAANVGNGHVSPTAEDELAAFANL